MDKTVRFYNNFGEMKADEYRYWQSRPAHERMDAVSEMVLAAYAMKGAPLRSEPRTQVSLDGPTSPGVSALGGADLVCRAFRTIGTDEIPGRPACVFDGAVSQGVHERQRTQ